MTTQPEGVVVTRGLTKRYGDLVALDGLDLTVPNGVVFGLLGPNGAGKTTTIRLLTGLARPTSGSATVLGVRLGTDELSIRRRIGHLDQAPRFYPWLRGRELVELVGRLHGLDGVGLRARVGEVLDQVGLTDAARRRIGGYSGGMRQRLGIAQALVNRPDLVILDEPLSSLDPEGRRDLLGLIYELRDAATILFSTHVLADVERVCDRIAILDRGRLVLEGPLASILETYAQPVFRLELARGQKTGIDRLVETLRASPMVSAVELDAAGATIRVTATDDVAASRAILAAVVSSDVSLDAFERSRPTLEDVFLTLVGRAGPDPRAVA